MGFPLWTFYWYCGGTSRHLGELATRHGERRASHFDVSAQSTWSSTEVKARQPVCAFQRTQAGVPRVRLRDRPTWRSALGCRVRRCVQRHLAAAYPTASSLRYKQQKRDGGRADDEAESAVFVQMSPVHSQQTRPAGPMALLQAPWSCFTTPLLIGCAGADL